MLKTGKASGVRGRGGRGLTLVSGGPLCAAGGTFPLRPGDLLNLAEAGAYAALEKTVPQAAYLAPVTGRLERLAAGMAAVDNSLAALDAVIANQVDVAFASIREVNRLLYHNSAVPGKGGGGSGR